MESSNAGQLLIHGIGPTRPSQETVMKLGTHVTASGNIKVESKSAKRKVLPGKRIRAKA
ncbi:MAG: hypothetical protein HC802_06965 [Caldilineaceae bacterium]|nr:hypothetical protein [Caldilineaceae bacterium]